MSTSIKTAVIRYSPLPRSSYRWESHGHSYGPATSSLIDMAEAWNLAFLSHPYEERREHPDHMFTTHVRRTTQSRLDGAGPDLTGFSGFPTVAKLLQLPAPRFVKLISEHAVLHRLPLYEAYGEEWLRTIEQRSWLCVTDDFEPPAPSQPAISAATELLKRLSQK